MAKPCLTFFCEAESNDLETLFSPNLMKDLAALDARVSLGILDLSPQRAEIAHRLNEAGIPVIAWLLLPKDQGYWMNADNASQAAARYQAFKTWTQENNLKWAGIGLDIEPDLHLIQQLAGNRLPLFWNMVRGIFNRRRLRSAREIYSALVWQIEADGYPVETYILPFILDERKVHSTLLQRATGLVDIRADREVVMLYSSLLRPNSPGLLWSFAEEVQSIGLGSTGGGIELEGLTAPALDWDELARDLRLAYVYSNDIYLYSLEGCVRQGMIDKMKSFEWDQPIIEPSAKGAQIDGWRHTLQTALVINRYIWPAVTAIIGLIYLINRLRHRQQVAEEGTELVN